MESTEPEQVDHRNSKTELTGIYDEEIEEVERALSSGDGSPIVAENVQMSKWAIEIEQTSMIISGHDRKDAIKRALDAVPDSILYGLDVFHISVSKLQ